MKIKGLSPKMAAIPVSVVLAAALLTGCAGAGEKITSSGDTSSVSFSDTASGGSSSDISDNPESPSLENSSVEISSSTESVPFSSAESVPSSLIESTLFSSAESVISSSVESETSAPSESAPHSHSYSREVLSYSTCKQKGSARYTCTDCGYSEERTEDIKGGSYHDLKAEKSVLPTCTDHGYTLYTCADCSHSEKSVDKSAKPSHDLKTEKVSSTCTQYGYTVYSCNNCSYSKKEIDRSQRPAHHYESKVVSAASKSSVGIAENVCSGCGRSNGKTYVNYFSDIAYKTEKNARADLAAMNLVEELDLKGGGSDLEKLCTLYKWYYENTKYDGTYTKYTAYDNLIDRTSVCQGYAEALCLILPKCGIEAYICSSDKLNHAWNLVKIDGEWTYTDFVGGLDFNSEHLILGSNSIGRTDDVEITEYRASDGNYWSNTVKFDHSLINEKLRLFNFDTSEIKGIEEGPGYFRYKIGNVTWTHSYKNDI